mgnify:CR=1 FL=1
MNMAKIERAAKRAEEVMVHWNKASKCLSEAWMNGYGVFERPTYIRNDLQVAKEEIEKAQALMREFDSGWPTDADYEALNESS